MRILSYFYFIIFFSLQLARASSGICIHCMYGNNYPYLPYYPNVNQFQVPLSYYRPWWYSYGSQNFVNYQYPGAWYSPGLQGSYYPGNGDMVVGKPNVYLYGPDKTHFTIEIDLKNGGNLLSAAPPLSEGWRGTIQSAGIEYQNVVYPYYYYDFRSMKSFLQAENGFCSSDNLIDEMANVLNDLHFNEAEISDFKHYWYFKLPLNEEYCVYPQLGADVEKVSKLRSSPSFEYVTRIFFLVIPASALFNDHKQKFHYRPKNIWKTPYTRTPQSGKLIYREWGVGFLTI